MNHIFVLTAEYAEDAEEWHVIAARIFSARSAVSAVKLGVLHEHT